MLEESDKKNRELGTTNHDLDRQVRALSWELDDKSKSLNFQTAKMNEALEKVKLDMEQLRDISEKRENALILHSNTIESEILDLHSQIESLKRICEDKIGEKAELVDLLESERLEALENEDKLVGQLRDSRFHVERVIVEHSSKVYFYKSNFKINRR